MHPFRQQCLTYRCDTTTNGCLRVEEKCRDASLYTKGSTNLPALSQAELMQLEHSQRFARHRAQKIDASNMGKAKEKIEVQVENGMIEIPASRKRIIRAKRALYLRGNEQVLSLFFFVVDLTTELIPRDKVDPFPTIYKYR